MKRYKPFFESEIIPEKYSEYFKNINLQFDEIIKNFEENFDLNQNFNAKNLSDEIKQKFKEIYIILKEEKLSSEDEEKDFYDYVEELIKKYKYDYLNLLAIQALNNLDLEESRYEKMPEWEKIEEDDFPGISEMDYGENYIIVNESLNQKKVENAENKNVKNNENAGNLTSNKNETKMDTTKDTAKATEKNTKNESSSMEK